MFDCTGFREGERPGLWIQEEIAINGKIDQFSNGMLDRDRGVGTMEVVGVDVIDPQPLLGFARTYSRPAFTTLPGSPLAEPNFEARKISLRSPVFWNVGP